jgi:hypothetical protein
MLSYNCKLILLIYHCSNHAALTVFMFAKHSLSCYVSLSLDFFCVLCTALYSTVCTFLHMSALLIKIIWCCQETFDFNCSSPPNIF